MEAFAQQFLDFARSVGPESRLRLAPTPSGFLHLGNALNFVFNRLAAGQSACYLRMDDLDADRKRPEYVDDVFQTLDWLGLTWHSEPVFQSSDTRNVLYSNVLEKLREQGLLFACRKSRRDLEPFSGQYPPEFRAQNLSLDAPGVAWRIQTPPGFPLPDFVVRRRDGIPAYQVASLADDLDMGITHIVRGSDLEASTEAQRFLAKSISEDKFLTIKFLHHPLLHAPSGEKLSKSAGSASLRSLREAGLGPETVFQTAGEWLGLSGNTFVELQESLARRRS